MPTCSMRWIVMRSTVAERRVRSPVRSFRGSRKEVAVSRGESPRQSSAACRGRWDGFNRCAPPLRTSEAPLMTRQNLFSDVWDGDDEETGARHRVFWRPDDARLGATLYELPPGMQEDRIHMHYGTEEMFFVLRGSPLFRNRNGEEKLTPGEGASPTWSPIPNTAMRGSRPGIRIPSYSQRAAIQASSRASRYRSSKWLGRSPAVPENTEEAARGLFCVLTGIRRGRPILLKAGDVGGALAGRAPFDRRSRSPSSSTRRPVRAERRSPRSGAP
jgi:hypothetical protein